MDKIAAFLRDIESLSELIRPIPRNMLNRHIDKLNMLASHVGVGNFTLAVYGEFYIDADIVLLKARYGQNSGAILASQLLGL